jgi:hypothetical protein
MSSPNVVLLLFAGIVLAAGPCLGQQALSTPSDPVIQRPANGAAPLSTMMRSIQDEEESRPRTPVRDSYLGFGIGTGAISIGDLYGMTEFSACFTKPFGDDEVGAVYLLVQHAPVQHTSRLKASLNGGVTIVGIVGDFRFYRTPLYTFIGHYLSAGIGVHALVWEYLHELQLPQYDDNDMFTGYERVTNDAILGFDLHAGMGFDIGQVWGAHLEGEVTPGLMLWSGKSTKGFNNDLFKPFLYLKARVMARIAL